MALNETELEKIGEYVKEHLWQWISSQSIESASNIYEIEMRERMVRVEEGLKAQQELMRQGFELMDKRFEQMQHNMDKRFEQADRRFEQVDKRFEQMDRRLESFEGRFNRITAIITVGFAAMAVLMSVYQFLT